MYKILRNLIWKLHSNKKCSYKRRWGIIFLDNFDMALTFVAPLSRLASECFANMNYFLNLNTNFD